MRRTAPTLLTLVALALASVAQAATLRFSIPTGENSLGKDQMAQTLQKMFSVVQKKTSVTLVLDPLTAYGISRKEGLPGHMIRLREYLKRLKAGTTDIVGVTAEEYFTHDALRALVTPAFAWSVNHQKFGKECLYVKKGSGITHVKQLQGKTITGLTSYQTVRRLLWENGVDMPLKKFFGKFAYIDDPMEQYQSLLAGKVDTFHDTWQGWSFYKNMKPQFKDVTPLACLKDPQPMVFFGLRKNADKAAAQKVGDYLITAHRDPEMASAKWFFLDFLGEFFKVDNTYLAASAKTFEDNRKRGWMKEAQLWHTQDSPALFKLFLKSAALSHERLKPPAQPGQKMVKNHSTH